MSLYPQSHYGQPMYSQYPPTVQNGYPYPYHQPPPLVPPAPVSLDPASFRREFTSRLAELTVNSRPIIQNLSMLAQDYSRFSEIVAQCLEAHIRRVPPWMKLPGFYLLDAISKNVYEPYARRFATFVIPLFLETYGQVDDATRSKMHEMLLTWRTGGPHGKELFGVPPQVAIERGIWGDSGSGTDAHGAPGHVTKVQVITELEFSLSQKERALQAHPYDTVTQGHVGVLHQLRALVEAGVSQEELQQILAQLRTLGRSKPPGPPLPAHPAASNWQPQPSHPAQQLTNPSQYPYPHQTIKLEDASTASTSTAPAIAPPIEIANILSTLLKAGVVSANGTPQGAGATSQEEAANVQVVEDENLDREASRVYRDAILSQPITLSSTEITRRRPAIVEFLYDQLTAQCKQCGVRFADSVVGKKRMEDHLDMHFRQNRKANQNIGRGHSRSWFIGVEDWVHDLSNDKGKGRADAPRRLPPKAAAAAELAKRDAELRSKFVVVPPGAEAEQISCPICKEILKSEFLDDEEDWVWRNAVTIDDRVYHATCHAEAAASTSTLAARLRNELGTGRSRSATPEASVLRTTPPRALLSDPKLKSPPLSPSQLAGTKRKVEEDDSVTRGEIAGTPPLKKMALIVLYEQTTMSPAAQFSRDLSSSSTLSLVNSVNKPPERLNHTAPIKVGLVDSNAPRNQLHATIQRIDQLANEDVEMKAPLNESSTFLVLDTNILLHHFDVISQFVGDAERYSLPIVIVIPGVVVYELDGQKTRDGLAWFARRASSWLLEKIKERKIVKGQANEETCKASRNWKVRVAGETVVPIMHKPTEPSYVAETKIYVLKVRTKVQKKATQKVYAYLTYSTGIPPILPTRNWSSREIAWTIFGQYGIDTSQFGQYKVNYRDPQSNGRVPVRAAADSEDMMMVDDDEPVNEMPQPSHALDLLHLQVIDHFLRLLIDLVGRVGGPEIYNCGNGASASQYAPQWQKQRRPYTEWSVGTIWEYLSERRKTRITSPRVDLFLSKPYSCAGARRGQDWSRKDWDVALTGLARFAEVWDDDSISESLGELEPHVEGIFAMKMRPTGI
ncbi:hypothetical protein H0H93_000123 [Arthromyces matolae]|nr:hypothetical protein H0H93_000123 [Arthromyces matolae]